MRKSSLYLLFAFFIVTALVAGCSKKEKTYTVSGTVSYKGELIPDGSISFVPSNSNQSFGSTIQDGKYTAKVRKGTMTVRITGSKPDPKQKMLDGSPFYTDFVPEKYGSKSTLTVEIKGNQTEDFNLD